MHLNTRYEVVRSKIINTIFDIPINIVDLTSEDTYYSCIWETEKQRKITLPDIDQTFFTRAIGTQNINDCYHIIRNELRSTLDKYDSKTQLDSIKQLLLEFINELIEDGLLRVKPEILRKKIKIVARNNNIENKNI